MIQEILEILKNIETFTITNIYNLLNNAKYKIQKNKNISYKLIDAPKFKKNINKEITHQFKEPYSEVVENFVSTLKEKIPESSLNAMYHNCQSLKINNIIFKIRYTGYYFYLTNHIILGPKNRGDATLSHELLHMSSCIIGKNNIASGFHTGILGRNLNEGYTELLNNRLFNHPITKSPPYNTYARFASIVEDIIGKEQMTNLYFNADLKTLFNQLSNYSSKEKTSVFLKDLDSLYQSNRLINTICRISITRLNRIINYLKDTTMNYINHMIKNETFSPSEAKLFLDNYKEKIISINTYINQLLNKNNPIETEILCDDNYLTSHKNK